MSALIWIILGIIVILMLIGVLVGLPPVPDGIDYFTDWIINLIQGSAHFGIFIYGSVIWIFVVTFTLAILVVDFAFPMINWVVRHLK